MGDRIRIANGRVVDPWNDVDEVRDVWIEDGRIVAAPSGPAARTIDATGDVVMAGGVDLHSHIAGPKVNAARAMLPEFARSDILPTTLQTGLRYAGLGYTTAFDAAIAPLGARLAHHDLRETPVIDKGFLVLAGNNHYLLEQLQAGELERFRDGIAWLLGATRGYGIKVVNPGGVERWKAGEGNITSLDDLAGGFPVTAREILQGVAQAVDELGLPHPVHVHGLNLGLAGNAATTLDTMRALDGHRAHLTHIQFHSYGGSIDQPGRLVSGVDPLIDYFRDHPNLTVDVGQVMFGETVSMTADGPVGQYLHRVTGRKWHSRDLELETGCGIVPVNYAEKNVVSATQWAIGLEWFLKVDDPWRVALTTDHPNGGSFAAYPQLIALLMDRSKREETLKRLPPAVAKRSSLAELDREYSLSEIAIITRAAPARMLGLTNKGHLGAGADGDVAVYAARSDREEMFTLPRHVLKRGVSVVEDGEPRSGLFGSTLSIEREVDPGILAHIATWFNARSSIRFANFPVRDEDLGLAS